MKQEEGIKILVDNRKARFNYFLEDRMEAGIVLSGSEVKSARNGKLHLSDAYAAVKNNELWLFNAHISPYEQANQQNHEPDRPRKLLVHRKEIGRLIGKTREQGLTLIPTKIYLKKGRVKCELALAKGKNFKDKRDVLRKKAIDDETRDAVSRRG
jgi:SsrA-binding protein